MCPVAILAECIDCNYGCTNRFSINEETGVIEVVPCPTPGSGNCLDYEQPSNSFHLSVAAVDELGNGQTAVVPVVIHLTDVNDNRPEFEFLNYTATIDQGSNIFSPPLVLKV